MYWEDTYSFPDSIEKEFKYAGNYGAKGEKREKKKKVTPKQIRANNQANRVTRIRRLIKANFHNYDHFVTLKYKQGTRKPLKEVKTDIQRFLRKLRDQYKRIGEQLKFILRIEIGKHGGIHAHIIINRIPYRDTDTMITKTWESITDDGLLSFEGLRKAGGYEKLAEYMSKVPEEGDEAYHQLSLIEPAEQKGLISYSTSRNLVRPVPERKKYSHWTMKRVMRDGIQAAAGYVIDQESIRSGVNPFTGYSFLKYTMNKISSFEEGDYGG